MSVLTFQVALKHFLCYIPEVFTDSFWTDDYKSSLSRVAYL